MKKFFKYAWALLTAALLLSGFYEWYYLGAGVGSGLLWYYVYMYRDKDYA